MDVLLIFVNYCSITSKERSNKTYIQPNLNAKERLEEIISHVHRIFYKKNNKKKHSQHIK